MDATVFKDSLTKGMVHEGAVSIELTKIGFQWSPGNGTEQTCRRDSENSNNPIKFVNEFGYSLKLNRLKFVSFRVSMCVIALDIRM